VFRVSALSLAACLAVACKAAPPPEPVLSGMVADGVVCHLDIEYAAAERWQLPDLNEDWDAASDFMEFGPACPQKGQAVMTEDCLFLNVFGPEDGAGTLGGAGFRIRRPSTI